MEREERLKEEIIFWRRYIKDWEEKHNELAPERAFRLLNVTLEKLNNHYLEEEYIKSSQGENRVVH